MTKAIGWGALAGLVALLFLDAVLSRAGLAGLVPRAEHAGPWIVSRAAGLTAYVALSLEVILGLAASTGASDRVLPRASVHELHRWLSSVALVLVVSHALALLGDRFAGLDLLDLTVPLASHLRRLPVALGIVAAYAMLGLHVSYGMRGKLGARTWRRLHYGSFALYAMATAHGLWAGTDAGRPLAVAIYLTSTTVVASLVAVRVARAQRAPARPA